MADPIGLRCLGSSYERFQKHLRRAYRSQARAIPEAEAVFEFLKDAGVQIVLTTGLDRDSADLLFQSLGWDALGTHRADLRRRR